MEISEYTETWFEYHILLRQVQDMDDEYLVDEIVHLSSTQNEVDVVVDASILSFFDKGFLTERERQILIACYILAYCEEEIAV